MRAIPKPRLLLVDDHHLVLEGLRLQLAGAFEIVGALDSACGLAETCRRLAPEVCCST
jgi:DNA-binding NarL/FixJ family response regulator